MTVDELFTKSEVDVRDSISTPDEFVPGVPVLTDVTDYIKSIASSDYSNIIRIDFQYITKLKYTINQLIDIIEVCLRPSSYKDIIIYKYKAFSQYNRAVVHFKINPNKIIPERMLLFFASLSKICKDKGCIDTVYFNSDNYGTSVQTKPIFNEMIIAKNMYTIQDYFFTAKDCQDMRDLFKILGFFKNLSEGDAYCYISDMYSKIRKIKNGSLYR